MVCEAWALQGYGTPIGAYAFYLLKLGLYVGVWLLFCSRTPGLGGPSTIADWWLSPLAFEKVEATRTALLRLYLSRGYLYARVEAREALDRDRHVAALRFVVDEGPQVRIGRIVVTGNRRTREAVVRRVLSVSEGNVYDPEQVARSQAALLRLGVFRSVGLHVQEPEVPQETKDLAIEVAERPWATLSEGAGFSIANGPRAFVEYGQPNLLGRALELTARGKVNYPLDAFRPDLVGKSTAERLEGRADLGVRAPGVPLLALAAGARGPHRRDPPPEGVRPQAHHRRHRARPRAHLARVVLPPVRARGGPD